MSLVNQLTSPDLTEEEDSMTVTSDGSTASYYELPENAKELQHLISHKDMNAQIGEIFRATYRYGECSHSDRLRDIKKIIFYAEAEKDRLLLIPIQPARTAAGDHVVETQKRKYSELYDAYYHPDTYAWLDPKCSSKDCQFCAKRPPTAKEEAL